MELKWTEISKAINGTDVNGFPLAAGTLAVDEITEGRAITLRNVTLTNAIFHIYASGGCAVITAIMPESHEVKALENICCEWLKNLDNPVNDNQYLTMTIIPILFAGKLSLLYNQLLYFDKSIDTIRFLLLERIQRVLRFRILTVAIETTVS